jgi:hypothetical protein
LKKLERAKGFEPSTPTLARKLAVALDATVQPHPRPPVVSGERGISG